MTLTAYKLFMLIAAVLAAVAAIFIGLLGKLDVSLAFTFGSFASAYLARAIG